MASIDDLIADIVLDEIGSTKGSYNASPIKRRRATKDEMEERAEFIINYAETNAPVTVRGIYYQAEVHGVQGIDKTDNGYNKVQRQVLELRRAGRLSYDCIADATRWMRKPRSHDSIQDALEETARSYRRNVWRDADEYVEVWLEKDALAGVVYPVTSQYDVPLMVTRGFSSETFAYEAIAARQDDGRVYRVYYLSDFDRAGMDASRSLKEKLERFGAEAGIEIIFTDLAVNEWLISLWALPTREPKRITAADRNWPHDRACELDAIPAPKLRELVELTINDHLPKDQLKVLKVAEESERALLKAFVSEARP